MRPTYAFLVAAAAPVAALLYRRRARCLSYVRSMAARARGTTQPRLAGIMFTGTGCSSTTPIIRCAIDEGTRCSCAVALRNGREDPNWRGNVSAVLRFIDAVGIPRHVQIDVGKTWRESAIRLYPRHGIRGIDAVIMTHEHADASLGLDDLRSLQMKSGAGTASSSLPVYADVRALKLLRGTFPYLFPRPPQLPGVSSDQPGAFSLMCACCEPEVRSNYRYIQTYVYMCVCVCQRETGYTHKHTTRTTPQTTTRRNTTPT